MPPTSRLQVAIDGRYIQDHFPGIGRYTYNLIDALARVAPAEQFVVLHNPALRNTRYDIAALARYPNVALRQVGVPTFSLREQWQIPQWLRQVRADVYHSSYYIMPYRLPLPTVVTVHDLIPLRYPQYYSFGQRLIFNITLRLAARAARQVITVSRTSANDLDTLMHVSPHRITTIYEAADASFAPQPREAIAEVRARYLLTDSYVLYLGSNKPHKNLVRLVEAFARARPPAAQLVIAGHFDPRIVGAQQRAAELNLGDAVRWLGPVPPGDLSPLLSGATLFAFVSEYEGFGLPVIEAMACGVPIVCSNAASLPEVVGDAAILVDPRAVDEIAGAITRVLSNAALRDELRAKSIARAAPFSWERAARETLAVYQNTSAGRPS